MPQRLLMHSRPLLPVGIVIQLIILIAFLAVLWWLLKGGSFKQNEDARTILDRRFASGDLNKKEYISMKKAMED